MLCQIRRALAFSENLNNVAHLPKDVIQPKAWSWGRRLAWIKLSLESFKPTRVAMYHSHFSANSSLFSFWKSPLRRKLAEGEKHKKITKLPSLRQNIIARPLGKTKAYKQQHSQVSWLWKHKELESWKTQNSIWSSSAIFLQRLRSQIFISP